MTKKVFNMEGGLHSAAAYAAFENRAYGNCVASTGSFVVSSGTGMNLNISSGDGLISVDNNLCRRIQTDATETVAVSAASPSFNRIDSVVAYIDTSVTPTTSVVDNINDILKFKCVAGTAAASPTPPSGAAIQSSIGAGNPYMVLYNVTIPQNATNTTGITLSDQRKVVTVIQASQISDGAVTTSKVADNAITKAKLEKPHFCSQYFATGTSSGGQVVQPETPYIFTETDSNAFGITSSLPTASYMTIARDGIYRIDHQVNMSDGAVTTTFICWFEMSTDNGATWVRFRQAQRALDIGIGNTYSMMAYLTAGTRVRVSVYSGTAVRLASPGSSANERYFNGPRVTITEIR